MENLKILISTVLVLLICATSALSKDEHGGRVVYGVQAAENQFPFFAFLAMFNVNGSTFICGGSLISPNFVLTAAHCMENVVRVYIMIGSNELNSLPTIRRASKFTMHENFTMLAIADDIGLVKLSRPVDYTPIALPTENYAARNFEGLNMTSAGFGRTENGMLPRFLLYTDLVGFSYNACRIAYPFFVDTMLCAKGVENSAICLGDSGGPLILENVLVGVNSYGSSTNCTNDVNGFTRVDRYLKWIKDTMAIMSAS